MHSSFDRMLARSALVHQTLVSVSTGVLAIPRCDLGTFDVRTSEIPWHSRFTVGMNLRNGQLDVDSLWFTHCNRSPNSLRSISLEGVFHDATTGRASWATTRRRT